MEKFQNKYRIPSARAVWWDYSSNGYYFVTICTAKMEHFFGEIENCEMKLSPIGLIANQFWMDIPKHFPDIELGAFVVMPNHIHGIIHIDLPDNEDVVGNVNGGVVETPYRASLPENTEKLKIPEIQINQENPKQPHTHHKNWQSNSLGVIINQFKRKCTIDARVLNPNFKWQTRFHDHIIRNDEEYNRIENYIINNVKCWEKDKFYTKK